MSGVVVSPCPDLRHSAITNMCQAGIDPLTIMQISGHKTMVCFTRDNSFWEADLKAAVCKSNTYLTLARIIHEGFCCNRRSAATTSLRPTGSPLSRSTYCFKYASLTAPRARLAWRLGGFVTNPRE